jgi:hypothetical protein
MINEATRFASRTRLSAPGGIRELLDSSIRLPPETYALPWFLDRMADL